MQKIIKQSSQKTDDSLSDIPSAQDDTTVISTDLKPTSVVAKGRLFTDSFTQKNILVEAKKMGASPDANWWVSSGAYFYTDNGIGSTSTGRLRESDPWRVLYEKNNPSETDEGYHPQNIFRLVSKDSAWGSYVQQVYYNVHDYNLSDDSHRDASNGLFLFNRYQDANTVYYTGLRVDGAVVIKKKYNGTYYQMASKKIVSGIYDRTTNPNLLPVGQWIGIRSEVVNIEKHTVEIRVSVDMDGTNQWKTVLEAVDDNSTYGGASIIQPGAVGIRTDFMDVSFKNYSIQEI